MPTTDVSSSVGAERCDWGSAHFLWLGQGKEVRQYARDPRGVLGSAVLTAAYDQDARMPVGARDTGYRFHDWELWLTAGRSAFIRTPDGVEAWPATKEQVGCK